MIEPDTVKLLRECDSGIKMGVASIDDVIDHVKAEGFQQSLITCRERHEALGAQVEEMLEEYGDEGREPNPMAKGMSWAKTNMKLALDGADSTAADLITDGCNMGVKSLSRYLNQYQAADEASKNVAKRLIRLEEELAGEVRAYL